MSNAMIPYEDIEKMGSAVAKSALFGIKTVEQAVALMLVAQAQGVHPATAAMEYHIIQGKPSKKAESMLASFIQAGGSVKWITLTDEVAKATFSHPQGGEVTIDWDLKRAEKAGLLSKEGSMYKKYPRSMLRSRCVSEGVRTVYPAATGGMRAPEEFDDEIGPEDVKKLDKSKSRLENIIETQAEEVTEKEPVKEKEEKKPHPHAGASTGARLAKQDEMKKEAEEIKKSAAPKPLKVEGVINWLEEEKKHSIPKVAMIENNGEPEEKFAFQIGDKWYGTFDKEIADKVMKIIDIGNETGSPIVVRFFYTERKKGDKTFQDITKFEQVTTKELPI